MRALPRLWAAAALLVWALWPMKLAAAPVLPGHWQGQIAGQTIALTLQADGGGLLDGQPIRYQAMGSNLLIERQGSVTVYVFELRGGMLLVAGGDLPGLLVLKPGASPQAAAAPELPNAGQAGNPRDLLGQWCKASSGNTSAGGWFTQYCFTLNADGSYEYFSNSDRSVNTTSIRGRATGQVLDAGRWTVTGAALTAQSQSGRVTTYNLRRGRDPRNGEAQLCLEDDCYGAMQDGRRW